MKIKIVPIGNSKGIRIPKTILSQCQIENEVDLEIEGKKIIIKSIKKKPRDGWDKAFLNMSKRNDDKLLIDDNIDLDLDDWEW